MVELNYTKCHAYGNDFVLLDTRQASIFADLNDNTYTQLAISLCDRAGLVGADGLLLIFSSRQHSVRMRMFNPDGAEAQTCCNGLRCIARYMDMYEGRQEISVAVSNTHVLLQRLDDMAPGMCTYSTIMPDIYSQAQRVPIVTERQRFIEQPIDLLSDRRLFSAFSAPNPHLVSMVDHIDERELTEVGDIVERGLEILPQRANVSFVQKITADTCFISTYERGIGITGSCGSATAVASVALGIWGACDFDPPIKILNRNGWLLCSASELGADKYSVDMHGGASFVYSASINFDQSTNKLSNLRVSQQHTQDIEAYGEHYYTARALADKLNIQCVTAGSDAFLAELYPNNSADTEPCVGASTANAN